MTTAAKRRCPAAQPRLPAIRITVPPFVETYGQYGRLSSRRIISPLFRPNPLPYEVGGWKDIAPPTPPPQSRRRARAALADWWARAAASPGDAWLPSSAAAPVRCCGLRRPPERRPQALPGPARRPAPTTGLCGGPPRRQPRAGGLAPATAPARAWAPRPGSPPHPLG